VKRNVRNRSVEVGNFPSRLGPSSRDRPAPHHLLSSSSRPLKSYASSSVQVRLQLSLQFLRLNPTFPALTDRTALTGHPDARPAPALQPAALLPLGVDRICSRPLSLLPKTSLVLLLFARMTKGLLDAKSGRVGNCERDVVVRVVEVLLASLAFRVRGGRGGRARGRRAGGSIGRGSSASTAAVIAVVVTAGSVEVVGRRATVRSRRRGRAASSTVIAREASSSPRAISVCSVSSLSSSGQACLIVESRGGDGGVA
jgi:hypothetical protein